MKFLLLLFVLGYASASIYDVLDEAADELVQDFMEGMNEAPRLRHALGVDDARADVAEDEIKTELGKKLREALNELLVKIKDAVEHGKTVKQDLMDKLKELKEKMGEARIEYGKKAKELIEKIKAKAKDFLGDLLDKLNGVKDKRFAETDVALADFNIKGIFKKLKEALLKKIDKEALKAKIEELFGKGSEMADQLLELLKEKSTKHKNKLLELIDRVLGDENDQKKRSIQDMWDKVKSYFKDLKIDLKEKYFKFGEWVKETVKKGLEKSKTKIDNIKVIAQEFVDHSKTVSKEVAVEALEFLRPYKDDLKNLWDQVKVAAKEILKKDE